MPDKLYGAKCHRCSHLLGPTHETEADVWPMHPVTGCSTCSFCQHAAFHDFASSHLTLDMFDPEVRFALDAVMDGREHPLINKLRAECQQIEADALADAEEVQP